MEANKLPDKVVSIELLRINRNIRKICSCENPLYDVDGNNRAVWCRVCGAWIDPYDAIELLKERTDYLQEKHKEACEKVQKLSDEIELLVSKRARLKVFKGLEQSYRSDMLPHCPECGKAFQFEKITGWTNRKYLEE